MSLQSLLDMRINRQKPTNCIQIIVGEKPKGLEDAQSVIYIPPNAEPRLMDFRPLVGLKFVLFHIGSYNELAIATLDAAVAAGGKCVAVSLPGGAHSALKFLNPKDERQLVYLVSQQRAALCQ